MTGLDVERASAPTATSPHRRRPVPVAAAGVAAGLLAAVVWQRANPFVLTTSVEIDAPADVVWDVLTDFDAYRDWNPFIVESGGVARVGSTLTNRMRSGGTDRTFTPTVLVADAGRELRWVGRLGVAGVFDGEHAFLIEPLGSDRVRLTQREDFRGVLVPFLRGMLRRDTLPAFQAMNEALRDRAEQRTPPKA